MLTFHNNVNFEKESSFYNEYVFLSLLGRRHFLLMGDQKLQRRSLSTDHRNRKQDACIPRSCPSPIQPQLTICIIVVSFQVAASGLSIRSKNPRFSIQFFFRPEATDLKLVSKYISEHARVQQETGLAGSNLYTIFLKI